MTNYITENNYCITCMNADHNTVRTWHIQLLIQILMTINMPHDFWHMQPGIVSLNVYSN